MTDIATDKIKTVIFLDFDGALFPKRFYILDNPADPVLVHMLNSFGSTGAKTVVISTARCNENGKEYCRKTLCDAGVKSEYIHEDVITNPKLTRWDSVQDFLTNHPEITDVIIFDDEMPNAKLLKFFHNSTLYYACPLVDEDSGLHHSQVLQLTCHHSYTI